MCIMHRDVRGDSTAPEASPPPAPPPQSQRRRDRTVTHLMYACQQGNVVVVRNILHVQGRAGATRRDRTGKTPLHYCCTSVKKSRPLAAQAADLLVMAAPELVDARDEDGFTPLHLAVIAGNMPLVTFLLASHADIRAVDGEQHSVVHWATVCGEVEALRAVLAANAPISTPDVHGGYPLHYAAQMCATSQEKDNELGLLILQTLLSHSKIDVTVRDGDGRQPLLWAASAGSPKAMLALIRAGAPVEAADKDGLTALHCAASRGHTECLDTLLTLCGASVDVIDSNGCTALHYAVTLGHADATALLLAHGANANRQDRKGRTPAHCGCAKGQFETVKMLAMHDANLWLRNARGDLPLHEAAGSGRRDLVKWLLESKPSNVNARNNDGRCPLHLAALNDNADMCKILIDHGALINPVLRTSKNVFMTPLDCALQRGFRSTAKYLQLQGGLPASKLGGGPGNIHVNIHENITVDISQSTEDESVQEVEDKKVKKTSRRKRVERSGKKPQKELAVVNTEVTVSEHNVNIQQSKSLKMGVTSSNTVSTKQQDSELVGDDQDGTISSARLEQRTIGRRPKKDTPDPRKKLNTMTQTSATIDSSPLRINENIKEINTLAQSIEAKAKSICKEVNHIESNLDQQSLTSFEEGQQSQQFVVEASVHPQPSSRLDRHDIDHQQYQDVIKSLKDELDAMKQEIKNLKRVEVHATEAKALSGEEGVGDTLKELKVLLEGRVKEIKETVEEFKYDIKNVMGYDYHHHQQVQQQHQKQNGKIHDGVIRKEIEEEEGLSRVDIELIRGLEKKVKELEKAAERMQKEVKTQENLESTRVGSGNGRVRSRSSSGRRRQKKEEILLRKENEDKIEVCNETEGDKEDKEKDSSLDSQQAIIQVEMLNQQDIQTAEAATTGTEAPQTEEVQAISSQPKPDDFGVFGESVPQQTRQEMLQMTSDIEAKLSASEELLAAAAATAQNANEDDTATNDQPGIVAVEAQPEVDVDQQIISDADDASARAFQILQSTTTMEEETESEDKKQMTTETEEQQAFEVLPPGSASGPDPESQDSIVNTMVNDQQDQNQASSDNKAFEVLDPHQEKTETETSSPDDTTKRKRFLKSEKRDHHLHLPRDDQLESSLDDANSESSFSSTATKREHKSFTVIEPQTGGIGMGNGTGIPRNNKGMVTVGKKKKLRSRSEEMRKNQENLIRRSKVPLSQIESKIDNGRRRAKSNLESRGSRIPVLPDLAGKHKVSKSETNLASMEEFSERTDDEDFEDDGKKKRVKKKPKQRTSKSAGSDYESSNLIDSGFEPSPRSTRIPKWRNVSDRGVNMTSVTQNIQTNIRRYHLERKIFQHLLDLKRLQIRAGQHNEAILVKRAIDSYHRSCAATVGGGRYNPKDFTFKSFERFLYESLRKIQKSSAPEYLKGLPEALVENPLFCTQSTNRCMHATHAYTGIPCAAYLPKMDHHTIPKIGYGGTNCKPQGFLPDINKNKAVTLELCHGNDKQIISLPTDRLDQNKRYYVTFTVKGESDETPPPENVMTDGLKTPTHQHSKSM